jgi:hypothetical protein
MIVHSDQVNLKVNREVVYSENVTIQAGASKEVPLVIQVR